MKIILIHLILFVLCSVQSVAEQGPGEMLSDFLAPSESAETKAQKLLHLVANQQERQALQEAVTNSHAAVFEALQSVMQSTNSEARAATIRSIGLVPKERPYNDLIIQALADSNSEVRAAALGAAVASDVSRSVIIDAALKEIQVTESGPALRVALAIAAQYNITAAQRPVAEMLVDQSGRVNELAARTMASYDSLPADLRPVIEGALERIEADRVKTETVYKYLPSAKRSTTTIPAKRIQAYLDEALANCEDDSGK